MKFQIGDKVKFLNEKGGGVISGIISSTLVNVMIDEGFEIPTAASALIKTGEEKGIETHPISESDNANIAENADREERSSQLTRNAGFVRLEKGVYFAFVPQDQKWLITGELDIYIINHTSNDIIYNLHLKNDKNEFEGRDYDVCSPGSKLHLVTLDRDDLGMWMKGNIQLMFHSSIAMKLIPPEDVDFRINAQRFLKEDQYVNSHLMDEKAFLYPLKVFIAPAVPAIENEVLHKEASFPQKEQQERSEPVKVKKPKKDYKEVDLHIHEIRDDYSNLQAHEILSIQLGYFEKKLEEAISERIPRVIFIHGSGKGTLKAEIIKKLNAYEGLHYFDASMAKYGTGAIEVYIKMSSQG